MSFHVSSHVRSSTASARSFSAANAAFNIKEVEKLRVAGTVSGDLLINDVDVKRLLAGGVTGALFWPVYAKSKGGDVEELRHQQAFIEHVMPPMSLKSLLNRTNVCPDCGRGWCKDIMNEPLRFVYRREDLANIQDFNLTWEWFGNYLCTPEEALKGLGGWPDPIVAVKPKRRRNTKVATSRPFGSKTIPTTSRI